MSESQQTQEKTIEIGNTNHEALVREWVVINEKKILNPEEISERKKMKHRD